MEKLTADEMTEVDKDGDGRISKPEFDNACANRTRHSIGRAAKTVSMCMRRRPVARVERGPAPHDAAALFLRPRIHGNYALASAPHGSSLPL
jgi:hypothetical protein